VLAVRSPARLQNLVHEWGRCGSAPDQRIIRVGDAVTVVEAGPVGPL
jgi:hypothetical protein